MPALMAEIRACLRLATPIVLAQLAMMGSRVADTIMAGRLSATDLAAVASGSSYWMILGLLVIGLANGLSPIVAQQRGGGEVPERIGHYLQQCLWVAVVVGLNIPRASSAPSAPWARSSRGLRVSGWRAGPPGCPRRRHCRCRRLSTRWVVWTAPWARRWVAAEVRHWERPGCQSW